MSSTYHAKLIYGFLLTSKQAEIISKKLEEENSKLWVSADEDNKYFYLEVLKIGSVDSYSYLTEIKKIATREQAEKAFNKNSFLKKNFKKENMKLLLMCDYV